MTIESLLIAVFFCFSILPLIAVVFRVHVQRVQTLVALVLLWLVVPTAMVATAIYWRRPEVDQEQFVTDRPIQVASDQYVGSKACRSCHPHEHATWYSSYHRTMTQLARPESVIGQFDGVSLTAGDVEFRLDREDDQFSVDMVVSMDPETPSARARIQRPVVMTTGSHHMQAYWFSFPNHSRHLGMLPFVYLKDQQRWIPRRAAFLRPPLDIVANEQGRWNDECIRCHATHGRLRPETIDETGRFEHTAVDTRVAEFGIACEACHGPGLEHVNRNRDPIWRYRNHVADRTDDTIVNPARLSHVLSSQVCGQCHGIHISYDDPEAIQQWAMHGHPYRPGNDLSESKVRYLYRCGIAPSEASRGDAPSANPDDESDLEPGSFWSDGMVRVSGREYNGLVETPCFQRGELSCLSCHEMHQSLDDLRPRLQWANDQLGLGMDGNRACVQCHDEFQQTDALVQHTHHPVGSAGSNCYNCHMSYTTYGLLKAIRSHQIDVPNVAVSVETGRPNACNQCHLDKTLDWSAGHLSDWYGIAEPELTDEQKSVAASVLSIMRGDAGQRALMAWSYGWESAQQASGKQWLAPYLAQLLDDPYDAVRFIAGRSLRTLPAFHDFEYDYVAPPQQRSAARRQADSIWKSLLSDRSLPEDPAILIDEQGQLKLSDMQDLLEQRDDRDIFLCE